ncbi:tyrosine-type recombinase/integrase [Streptomyces mexicanus]|uniref:tyrosine-type recombinase/integrase n=1 Tax=Streptomyces mexicanus TaxID=178566 RepID=UPI0031ECC943
MTTAPLPEQANGRRHSPIGQRRGHRSPVLSEAERRAIRELGLRNLRRLRYHDPDAPQWTVISRLIQPMRDVNASFDTPPTMHMTRAMNDAIAVVILRCADVGRAYWDWTDQEWLDLLGHSHKAFREQVPDWAEGAVRPFLCGHAYHLGGFVGFHQLGRFDRLTLACRIFGRQLVEEEIGQVRAVLTGWGYQYGKEHDKGVPSVMSQLFLLNRSPYGSDLTTSFFDRVRREDLLTDDGTRVLFAVQRALAELGFCESPILRSTSEMVADVGVPPGWAEWVERWTSTTTLTRRHRLNTRAALLKVGRWIASEQPGAEDPTAWTRQTCAAWIAAVDRMKIGDYVVCASGYQDRVGQPLQARSKAGLVRATRVFFRDVQEWEWLPRRFDPLRALAVPRTINALIGPSPRVIADDVWAKLLWAGLNLQTDDVPCGKAGPIYPVELVRAVTLTWLFSGQRSNEIARLRLGCIRWQHDGAPVAGNATQVLAQDAVCLLDVPAHKTGTAFTKPVDPLLGQAINAWEALRPSQPKRTDRRTGEQVDYLFSYRARAISSGYINSSIIPMLCRKAGIPTTDIRGSITSHRARSTIASQLYNAKEPMTLFELQAWLGHRSPQSTQHYAKITPNALSRAYSEAGYFERNVRTIEVLVDRDAVASGAAAAGEPWQHYDLGHGYCTYTFFEQCQHRMACARCDFYTPKNSTKAQLLEAKGNLQKMAVSIPLTEDEQAAVTDGQTAIDQLLARLVDTPTPAGPTPREIEAPGTARLLPIVDVRQGKATQA